MFGDVIEVFWDSESRGIKYVLSAPFLIPSDNINIGTKYSQYKKIR